MGSYLVMHRHLSVWQTINGLEATLQYVPSRSLCN